MPTLPRSTKRLILTCFFSLISFVISSLHPTRILAQQVGTHLGEGDIIFQVKIMDLLAINGAGDGFPVTVLIRTNTSQAEIDALAAGARRNNFFPIVRIDEVCSSVDAARVISMARTAFGPEAPIEWGNEVNNKAVECANYDSYSSEYRGYVASRNGNKGGDNVGPSALDFYNTDYPAQAFLDSFSLDGDDVYFANAYGCVGGTVGDCNPETTTTQDIGMAYPKSQPGSVFYLTEFSLSPGGGDSAPDTNLVNVIKFIETNASRTGAAAITPLIRNVCNDDGEWLIYLNGQVMTRNGAFIDPATCSATDSSKANYYLYPLETLQDAVTNNLTSQAASAAIGEELINQGYEVSCTSPQGLFRASMEKWEQYVATTNDVNFVNVPEQLVTFTRALNYKDVEYPLFRSSQPANDTNDSIEAHFGYLETNPVLDEIGKETKSAALYKLLTLDQQCEYQKKILTAIDAMCNKLQDPSSCALYQPIPNSSYTTETLYKSLESDDLACDFQSRRKASETDKKRYDALANTPLYLDKAYRLAFIVFTAQQRGSIDLNDNGWDFLFNGNDPSGQPEDEVRIIAFKLPDIGTNKDRNSDIYYDDPLMITRDALTDTVVQTKRIEEYEAKRNEFLQGNLFASNLSFPSTDALVNCSGPACEDPLGRALVNIINSGVGNFDASCNFPTEREKQKSINQVEESDEIKVSGSLNLEGITEEPTTVETGLGTFFKDGFQLLTNIFRQPDEAKTNPQFTSLSGTTSVDPYQYVNGAYVPAAKFNAYLIYPVGYEYDQVVNTLAGSIKSIDQLAEFNDPEKVEPYFMLDNVTDTFVSEVVEFPYSINPAVGDCPPPTVNPETGELNTANPCQKTIDFKALSYINDNDGNDDSDSDIDPEPRIKGGLLGQVMRDIQLSLRRVGSDAWYYIDSCKTTEDFLLGNCDEDAAEKARTGDGLADSCNELYGADGETPTMTVYDREQTFRKVVIAAQNAANSGDLPADEVKRFAQTLWGVLQIEGSPYLRLMRATPDGQTTTTSCADTINTCGAVGPLQIIQGACVSDSCGFSDLSLLRSFERPADLCNIEEALAWTATNLLTHYDSSLTNADQRHAAMAGSHAGLGRCDEDWNSQRIGGCNTLSYCDCASFGFDEPFNDMWALWGGTQAPQATIEIR